ncbi:hypothetical protein GWK47_017623 [Chionoecetes opilio]|uniref:Uncharacterized protein n=1 Tax=Chionoecetes opilio TaxID=41210 RepID=A0A8J4XTP5_CHIOP|nr:hypothetical protein GWK47_017623 [Chionoecetes opilio]
MFSHILDTRPTKVRLCWLARERGNLHCIPTGKHRLVLRVATLGGCRSPARWGTPCTCALWNTTSAATSLRVSMSREDSPARTGLVGLGGLQHPPVAGLDAGCCPASECARLRTTSRRGRRTLSKAVSGPYRARASLPCRGIWLPFAGQRPCERPFFCNVFDVAVKTFSSRSTSTPEP